MRLTSQDEARIVVTIKQAQRDTRKTIEVEENGKKKVVENKMYGKIIYVTVPDGSIDVYEAQGAEVVAAVQDGLRRATSTKK